MPGLRDEPRRSFVGILKVRCLLRSTFILTPLHRQNDACWFAVKQPRIMRMRNRLLLQVSFKGDVLGRVPCPDLSMSKIILTAIIVAGGLKKTI